jgi:hypothetical protein
MLSGEKLSHQRNTWKFAMKANAAQVMKNPILVTPLTRLWRNIGTSARLRAAILEWIKVAEIAIVQVLGSIKGERTFLLVTFSKGKVQNHLDKHLERAVGVYLQNYYTLKDFPFKRVYEAWRKRQEAQDRIVR